MILSARFMGALAAIGLAVAIAGVTRAPAFAPAPDGTLIVREHQLRSNGFYIEGYVSFLRVHDDTGKVVIRRRFEGGDSSVRLRADTAALGPTASPASSVPATETAATWMRRQSGAGTTW